MCFFIYNGTESTDLFGKAKKKTVYKVVRRNDNDSRIISVVKSGFEWKVGQNRSDRQNKEINIQDCDYLFKSTLDSKGYIEKGIHIFTTLARAEQYLKEVDSPSEFILPVLVYPQDLVSYNPHDREAVFMKVTVEKRTWERINAVK